MRPRLVWAIVGAVAVAASGCDSTPRIWVTGQILESGQPYPTPKNQSVLVTFYVMVSKDPTVSKNEPFAAIVDPDSKFVVPGAEGRGIPPGKYRISVIRKRKTGSFKVVGGRGKKVIDRDEDFLQDRFGQETSPIVRDLSASCELPVDLNNPNF